LVIYGLHPPGLEDEVSNRMRNY